MHSLNVLQGKPAMHQTDNHNRVPAELGWPLWLAYAEDSIFESLPDDLAKIAVWAFLEWQRIKKKGGA